MIVPPLEQLGNQRQTPFREALDNWLELGRRGPASWSLAERRLVSACAGWEVDSVEFGVPIPLSRNVLDETLGGRNRVLFAKLIYPTGEGYWGRGRRKGFCAMYDLRWYMNVLWNTAAEAGHDISAYVQKLYGEVAMTKRSKTSMVCNYLSALHAANVTNKAGNVTTESISTNKACPCVS